MGFPSRIGIATHGYRRDDGEPGKICIATHGYRCIEPVSAIDPFGGGKGHGVHIQERYEPEPDKNLAELALLAVIAIEQNYD